MFHDFTSYNIQSRDLTPAQKHRAEYLDEIRSNESPEKEVAQPDREYVALATRLTLSSYRSIPRFLHGTRLIRRQLAAAPGTSANMWRWRPGSRWQSPAPRPR